MAQPDKKIALQVIFPAMLVQWALGDVPSIAAKPQLLSDLGAIITLAAVVIAIRFDRRVR